MRFRRSASAAFRFREFYLLATLVVGFSGCSTVTPEPATPVPQWQASALIESMSQRRQQFQSLRSLARVNYAGPDGKHGFQEAVLVQRPDRFRLETLTMLGAVLIVTANEKEIIGYHPRDGVLVRGQSVKENLFRYTQIPLDLEEITALLVGLPPVEAAAPWQQEGNSLIFSPNGRKKDAVAFESHLAVPTQWQRFGGGGTVELIAQFADYIATPAGLFPSKINVEAVPQGKKLEIRFQEPEINSPMAAELFSQQIPPNVRELPIEAIGS